MHNHYNNIKYVEPRTYVESSDKTLETSPAIVGCTVVVFKDEEKVGMVHVYEDENPNKIKKIEEEDWSSSDGIEKFIFAKTFRKHLSKKSTKVLEKIKKILNVPVTPLDGYSLVGVNPATGVIYRS